MNHATSNIISSIVYGSRFEYSDPQFKAMVARANENIRIVGSASIQVSIPISHRLQKYNSILFRKNVVIEWGLQCNIQFTKSYASWIVMWMYVVHVYNVFMVHFCEWNIYYYFSTCGDSCTTFFPGLENG